MINTNHAINYLKQVVTQLEIKEDELHRQELSLETQKNTILAKMADLTASKSAFLKKVDGYGAEVKRTEKLHALAIKMKQQVDEDRKELDINAKLLEKRKKEVINLEAKQKQLEDREKLIESRESEVEEKETIIEKDKKANRAKQEDLDLRAKSIKTKQIRLQKMIDNQKI